MKQEIKFHNNMISNKRDTENGAYLIVNKLKLNQKGFYPANNMVIETEIGANDGDIVGLFTANHPSPLYLYQKDNDDIYWDWLNDNTPDNFIANGDFRDVTYGTEARIILRSGEVYTTGGVKKADVSGRGVKIIYDGIWYYYITNTKIFRQLDDEVPTEVFNGVPANIKDVFTFGNQIVIVSTYGNIIRYFFWDKKDPTYFEKRVELFNTYLIATGVVNGQLVLIREVGNTTNSKEKESDIEYTVFNGESFDVLNTLKMEKAVNSNNYVYDVGNSVIVARLEIEDHDRPTMARDWLFKAYSNGNMVMLEDFSKGNTDIGYDVRVRQIKVGHNYIVAAGKGRQTSASNKIPLTWTNHDGDEDYDDYYDFRYSEYITNFYGTATSKHKMIGLKISFEELFEQHREELNVYYRTSDREQDGVDNPWILLAKIDSEKIKNTTAVKRNKDLTEAEYSNDKKGLGKQVYTIVKQLNPDGTYQTLPEFNEIQFAFESKKGFSIIDAELEYDYLTRETYGSRNR